MMDGGHCPQWYMDMASMAPPPMPQALCYSYGSTAFPQVRRPDNRRGQQNQQNQQRGAGVGGQLPRNKRPQQQQQQQGPQLDNAVTPLYKTRLCNFFVYGACTKGTRCPFAHGEEDLRASPNFEKTSACPTMLNEGTCDKPNCRYAHSIEELRSSPGLLKTKMCSFFLDGLCIVGEACRFAHSAEELREAAVVQQTVGRQEEEEAAPGWWSNNMNSHPLVSGAFIENYSQPLKPNLSGGYGDVASGKPHPKPRDSVAAKNVNGMARDPPPTAITQPAVPPPSIDAPPTVTPLEYSEEPPSKPAAPAAPTTKPAFTEEFSQVAAAMRSIFVDDDDDDAFAGFTGKASLTDPADSVEPSTDLGSNESGSAPDDHANDVIKVTAKNTFICTADEDENVERRRRSKSR